MYSAQRIHKISMSIFSNVIRVLPAFTPYISGVPDKVYDFVGCSYTLHQEKSHQNAIFLAHLANFLYLCNRFLRWREICPAKSVLEGKSATPSHKFVEINPTASEKFVTEADKLISQLSCSQRRTTFEEILTINC